MANLGKDMKMKTPVKMMNVVETIQGTGAVVKFTDKREAIFERQYYRVKVE